MAKNIIKLELTKKELIKYIYAVECAICIIDSHESPLLNEYLTELNYKLTSVK